jgi:biopolymer transport protein ExbB
MILLQTVTDTLSVAGSGSSNPPIFKLLLKGGWVMIPILILLAMAIYLFFERLLTVRRAGRVDRNFMNQVQEMVQNGNIQGARSLCKHTDTPSSRVLDKGLKKIGKHMDEIEKALESAGKIEVYKLEKNLSVLGTISGIAPMMGFLGTIAGVISIFYEIAKAKNINIEIVSEGLYQKMITSAAGLTVGILAHIFYHYLLLRIDREIFKMEANAIDFIDLLQEPTA